MISNKSYTPHTQSDRREKNVTYLISNIDNCDGKHNSPTVNNSRCDAPTASRTPPLPRSLPPDAFSTPLVSSFTTKDYRREADRLISLQSWPAKEFMNIESTAKSGLFYYGEEDKVRCQFCRVVLSKWEPGDDADTDHNRWSNNCPLLRKRPVGNVPIPGADECGIYENKAPKHPAFMTEASRLESFRNWPARMQQSPRALADAGFYYAGSLDQTVCYYCGGGLKDWEDEDDPWEQHALWFTRCSYLRLVKGEEFINNVLKAKTSLDTSAPDKSSAATDVPNQETDDKSDDKLCKICFVSERNTCFIPCGHVVACPKCAMSVSSCPICRKEFTSTVKIYFS